MKKGVREGNVFIYKVLQIILSFLFHFLFYFILILLIFSIFIKNYFSSKKVNFEIRKTEQEDEIEIQGLNEKDIEEIEWKKGIIYSYYPLGKNNKQYRFYNKERWRFTNLISNPNVYQSISSLDSNEIVQKKIKFKDVFLKEEKIIPKAEPIINDFHDVFAEKKWGLKEVFNNLFNFVYLIGLIFLFDTFFSTNFIGILFFPFKKLLTKSKEKTIKVIKFKDIGGLQEAKEELKEVVSYFQNPQIFLQRGASIPKGILLVGEPGNGKTLLAKALAGECGLPFLFRSGSEFEEIVVGLGARRMRELFKEARNFTQGCIIFIDEIDAIGQKRYSKRGNFSELTLNQLLNELDGFCSRNNIIVLAATNSSKVLDDALLRPGRFDRLVYVPFPNLKGRLEIIKICSRKLLLEADIDLAEISSITKGLSGAQIVNLLNEACILSIRHSKKTIGREEISEAYDRSLMGSVLTSYTVSVKNKRIFAYHEAGHAIIGMVLPETTVRKITIVPRLSCGGYTRIELCEEQEDSILLNKKQMLAQVMVSLGGRISEELSFGSDYITIGAYDDFKKASEIVQKMILNFGMSELGIVPTQESFFHNEDFPIWIPEETKRKIEKEREKILDECWKKVKSKLLKKKKILCLLAETLIKKVTLQKREIDYIFIVQTPLLPILI